MSEALKAAHEAIDALWKKTSGDMANDVAMRNAHAALDRAVQEARDEPWSVHPACHGHTERIAALEEGVKRIQVLIGRRNGGALQRLGRVTLDHMSDDDIQDIYLTARAILSQEGK